MSDMFSKSKDQRGRTLLSLANWAEPQEERRPGRRSAFESRAAVDFDEPSSFEPPRASPLLAGLARQQYELQQPEAASAPSIADLLRRRSKVLAQQPSASGPDEQARPEILPPPRSRRLDLPQPERHVPWPDLDAVPNDREARPPRHEREGRLRRGESDPSHYRVVRPPLRAPAEQPAPDGVELAIAGADGSSGWRHSVWQKIAGLMRRHGDLAEAGGKPPVVRRSAGFRSRRVPDADSGIASAGIASAGDRHLTPKPEPAVTRGGSTPLFGDAPSSAWPVASPPSGTASLPQPQAEHPPQAVRVQQPVAREQPQVAPQPVNAASAYPPGSAAPAAWPADMPMAAPAIMPVHPAAMHAHLPAMPPPAFPFHPAAPGWPAAPAPYPAPQFAQPASAHFYWPTPVAPPHWAMAHPAGFDTHQAPGPAAGPVVAAHAPAHPSAANDATPQLTNPAAHFRQPATPAAGVRPSEIDEVRERLRAFGEALRELRASRQIG